VKKAKQYRVMAAWLLLVVFSMPFAVKSVHACILHETSSGQRAASHDCTNCPICHFFFSYFTSAVEEQKIFINEREIAKPETYRAFPRAEKHYTLPPRAPPVA
jgi:hypothetical protein